VAIFDPNIFDRNIFDTPPITEIIRNFSLKSWRKWIKDEDEEELIKQGFLPPELKSEAAQAVIQSVDASTRISQEIETNKGILLLQAMEAKEAFDRAYLKAYREGYVEEVVNELWDFEIRRLKRNRAISLLLLY
jgi:uncharacterized lipoprotein YddW (UPF0748 family)